jgi:hypothetical protein
MRSDEHNHDLRRACCRFLLATTLAAAPWGPALAEPAETDSETLGEPLAAGIMELLEKEIVDGLKRRGIEAAFARFERFAGQKLDNSAGASRSSEVTGICRLAWFDHLLRNPLKAPGEAERFTRQLHTAFHGDQEGFDRALLIAREKMQQKSRPPIASKPVTSPEEALLAVRQALSAAQAGHAKALSTLTRGEIDQLSGNLYLIFAAQARKGHTLPNNGTARSLCQLLEKLDQEGIYAAADALVPLLASDLLEQLASLPSEGGVEVPGVTGTVVRRIVTPAGDVIVGGAGQNTYQLDQMSDVGAVIDLGGNDTYHEGTVSFERPVLILIDLDGNDTYRATRPGAQGAAVLGISLLLDVAGDDVYQAQDVAQGSCLGGAGILVDMAGNDTYVGLRRVQGHALGGLGILLDRAGDDRYHAALWAQGLGHPLGFGVLDDLDGADHYFCGGLYLDSYDETPGYDGWGQGVGAGIRQVANGGIGTILDGGGDDIYEFDYMSHGGGYWLGAGFARDFGGNDQRLGATRKAYGGGSRGQSLFQRFSNGYGCHYALGFLFDDAGDDTYNGTIMGIGFAWDCAVGVLCDFAGSDRYEATGGGTQGNGAQAGLGILYDYDGDDVYLGYGQGNASPSITYHDLPACGGNFGFVVDYGGEDSYGCGAKNSTYNRRGSEGGFLVDRPRHQPQPTGNSE